MQRKILDVDVVSLIQLVFVLIAIVALVWMATSLVGDAQQTIDNLLNVTATILAYD